MCFSFTSPRRSTLIGAWHILECMIEANAIRPLQCPLRSYQMAVRKNFATAHISRAFLFHVLIPFGCFECVVFWCTSWLRVSADFVLMRVLRRHTVRLRVAFCVEFPLRVFRFQGICSCKLLGCPADRSGLNHVMQCFCDVEILCFTCWYAILRC